MTNTSMYDIIIMLLVLPRVWERRAHNTEVLVRIQNATILIVFDKYQNNKIIPSEKTEGIF